MFERLKSFFGYTSSKFNPPDGLFFFENPEKVPNTKKQINPLESLRASLSDPDRREYALQELSSIALGGNKEARAIIQGIENQGLPPIAQRNSSQVPTIEYRTSQPQKGDIPLHNL